MRYQFRFFCTSASRISQKVVDGFFIKLGAGFDFVQTNNLLHFRGGSPKLEFSIPSAERADEIGNPNLGEPHLGYKDCGNFQVTVEARDRFLLSSFY